MSDPVKYSSVKIARQFRRDHKAVLNGIRQIKNFIETNDSIIEPYKENFIEPFFNKLQNRRTLYNKLFRPVIQFHPNSNDIIVGTYKNILEAQARTGLNGLDSVCEGNRKWKYIKQ